MEQDQIIQAQMLEKQYQELEQNLQLVDTQILELEQFNKNLDSLINSKENSCLSTLGKGIFIESKIQDKNKIFVEVGSNVIVKKSPIETKNVIENQITRLKEARVQISSQIEIYQSQLQFILDDAQKTI